MKKELKGFVCGVLTTALVAGGAAFAAGQWKTIDVLENDITVMVDGVQLNESNFLYNDRTYLPLRAVAEAVGKSVEYDETTNTAYIGVRETATVTDVKYYSDFPWCPDFGAYTGAALETDSTYKDYRYKTADDDWLWPDVEYYKEHIDNYVALLKSLGYQEGKFAGVDNMIILKNDKYSISIEYTEAIGNPSIPSDFSLATVRIYPERYDYSVVEDLFIPVE